MGRQFKVGDVCRVRQWDDMENEFGLNGVSSINCRAHFVSDMIYMCGEKFTIKSVEEEDGIVSSVEGIERGWSVSADMLELIENTNKIVPHTGKEVCDFLFCK